MRQHNPSATALPLPPHHDPTNATRWGYAPDQLRLFEQAHEWRRRHDLRPAGGDARSIHLLLIDVQKDFCFPEGTLFVAGRAGDGAIADNQRIAAFIYRNLGALTQITTTMDTHFAHQIFFPSFWVDHAGAPLSAHREITTAQIRSGDARPNPAVAAWLCNGNYGWLRRQVEHYCQELERAGKYTLYSPTLDPDPRSPPGDGVIRRVRPKRQYPRGLASTRERVGGRQSVRALWQIVGTSTVGR